MKVFSKSWFEHYQAPLVRFANTKLGRWALKLPAGQIWKLTPNSFHIVKEIDENNKADCVAKFYEEPFYATRLRKVFWPVWWAMHFLDWLVLDRFTLANKWSFGFSTLTVRPDASFVDGYVGYNATAGSETFAACRAGAGTFADIAGGNIQPSITASSTSNQYAQFIRGILRFDTSSLTAPVTVTGVTLAVVGDFKANDLGGGGLCLVSWTAGSVDNTLTATDYAVAKFGSTEWATRILYAAFDAAGTNTFTFNATGISGIAKTGTTKIGVMEPHDLDNSAPTWVSGSSNLCEFLSSRASGTTNDPTLVVTYSLILPGGGTLSMMGI